MSRFAMRSAHGLVPRVPRSRSKRSARCALLAMLAAPTLVVSTVLAGTGPEQHPVRQYLLDNGMKVIVKEDRRAPVFVSMVWYRVGSMDETTGATGVAHVLEHMMFKGSRQIPPGEFARIIARAGGRDNAYTNRDYTVYFEQMHKSHLALALRLEADRMANLVLSDEEFAKEIQVVMEERRLRTDDQPRSRLYETLAATAYQAHPYRTPVVGWMNDLTNMRAEDARDWYRRWYAPNNATLVVVGDVSADEVLSEAQRQFGAIPAKPLVQRKLAPEPPQQGIRRVQLKAPAELAQLFMAWHAPSLRDVEADWDVYALWVLAAVLDGGEAARLSRVLVRESRTAVSAGASYDAINRGPALFVLSATPAAGKTPQELEAALRSELQRIAKEGVSEEELKRVHAQVAADQIYRLDSTQGQAMQIGILDNAQLPPDSLWRQVQQLQKVSSAQVQAVVRRYLVDDNLTVAVLDPQPLPGRVRTGPGEQR